MNWSDIMATKRLFWEDSYLDNCEATVIKVDDNEVILDQTIFYAFSGGQASDYGTINEIPVKEARKAGDDILYKLESPPGLKEGDKVNIKIDLENRLKLMKLHSASHLVYFLMEKKTGLKKIIGSNVTVDKGRLDYEYPEPISSLLPDVESMANELFNQDNDIKIYPDPKDPNKRWWECKGWKVPCGGTHVKNTNEIGNIRLKRKNIGSGKERIEIYLK
jgi:Ser-tRNA(Ala) deacylase AlaX